MPDFTGGGATDVESVTKGAALLAAILVYTRTSYRMPSVTPTASPFPSTCAMIPGVVMDTDAVATVVVRFFFFV